MMTPAQQSSSAFSVPTLRPSSATSFAAKRNAKSYWKNLGREYILSHDQLSPALIAGIEEPPANWINQRLAQLGEKWTVGTAAQKISFAPKNEGPRAREGAITQKSEGREVAYFDGLLRKVR
jgi:hypothetical protein